MSKGFIVTIIIVAVLIIGGLIYWYSMPGQPATVAPAAINGVPGLPSTGAPGTVSPGASAAPAPAPAPVAPPASGFGY